MKKENTIRIGHALGSVVIGAVLSAAMLYSVNTFLQGVFSVVYVLSATPTAMLLGWMLPDDLTYWLVPEGGAPAAMLLYIFSAWLQYMLIFAWLTYDFLKKKRVTLKTAPHPSGTSKNPSASS